jgi:hypothetical protein
MILSPIIKEQIIPLFIGEKHGKAITLHRQ